MKVKCILSDYVEQVMLNAVYDRLENGASSGRIPLYKGVLACGTTLRECEEELRPTLEGWIVVGLELKHPLPVISGLEQGAML